MLISEQKPDLRLINPLTLAFVGDGVYEMLAREEVVFRHTSLSAKKLHILTVELVRATAQCRGFEAIKDELTEEEMNIFKRGRNANGVKPPKHADPVEYRRATGLEALFGYLFLQGKMERLEDLFELIMTSSAAERE